ncbi:TPA: oligosaccharide flippase family protein [Klebsiella variicola]|nr:oligosaccharide flippase family protein [Klebsiella variicola]HBZ8108536.1 oligosaccharide flippase family protein [Klebsiella variicola subsp. variicola]HCB0023347.1 oligosaccharide flippase family protein [Klebsiella variicola subsp. variicola]HCB0187428.1 oligosaccharide flippase family protein [Klebsiella variicola subsp. variicola]HCB0481720.1 oligosaccharide flippase family protein [Klebsiella variicola subsp. variicola]
MMSEKIISIFGLIFVTSFVAKYVGPTIFGDIALAMSIFQLVQIISQLGSDVLIFKRISRKVSSGVNLINVTLPLRVSIYLLFSLPVLLYSFIYNHHSGFYYVLAAFIACLLQALDVYAIYYDALLKSKVNTLINIVGLIISLLVRWLIAYFELNPLWLVIPIVLAALIPFSIRYIVYITNNASTKISPRYQKKYKIYLLKAGSTFVLSSVSVAIYTRLSLFILGFFYSSSAVGLFSVASTLATSWAFILNSIIVSTLPSIFSENNKEHALKQTAKLNIIVILISVPIVLGVYLLGGYFIDFFYGAKYHDAVEPLRILCISTVIAALGTVSARFIAKYSGYLYLSKKMLSVAITSLFLNLLCVYFGGVKGAAFATLTTEFISLTLFNYFFKNGLVLKLHKDTCLLKLR